MRKALILVVLLLVCAPAFSQAPAAPNADVVKRADTYLNKMPLEEKIDYIGGTGFAVRPVPALGLPAFRDVRWTVWCSQQRTISVDHLCHRHQPCGVMGCRSGRKSRRGHWQRRAGTRRSFHAGSGSEHLPIAAEWPELSNTLAKILSSRRRLRLATSKGCSRRAFPQPSSTFWATILNICGTIPIP